MRQMGGRGRWQQRLWSGLLMGFLGLVGLGGWMEPVRAVTPGQIDLTTEAQTHDQALAAGEPLVFSLKLLNFGSVSRADVVVTYEIVGADGRVRYRESETIAVDTTAALVKQIVLPSNLGPGAYTLRTRITYNGQVALAESEFSFEVEEYILGLRKTTFLMLLAATGGVLVIFGGAVAWAVRSQGHMRSPEVFDYSHRKADEKVYFELIGESIAQMRRLNGDAALKVAMGVRGLRINPRTGEVLAVTGNPMVVMNVLVLRFETLLGRRMSEVMQPNGLANKEDSR